MYITLLSLYQDYVYHIRIICLYQDHIFIIRSGVYIYIISGLYCYIIMVGSYLYTFISIIIAELYLYHYLYHDYIFILL